MEWNGRDGVVWLGGIGERPDGCRDGEARGEIFGGGLCSPASQPPDRLRASEEQNVHGQALCGGLPCQEAGAKLYLCATTTPKTLQVSLKASGRNIL